MPKQFKKLSPIKYKSMPTATSLKKIAEANRKIRNAKGGRSRRKPSNGIGVGF